MKIDIRSLSEDKLCEFFENKGFETSLDARLETSRFHPGILLILGGSA